MTNMTFIHVVLCILHGQSFCCLIRIRNLCLHEIDEPLYSTIIAIGSGDGLIYLAVEDFDYI